MKNPAAEMKKIAQAALLFLLGSIFTKSAGLLYRLIAAKTGHERYGLFSLGIIIFEAVAIPSLLGLNTGLIHLLSYYNAKQNLSKMKEITTSAVKLSALISLGAGFTLYASSGLISKLIFHAEDLSLVLKIFSAAVPFWVLASILISVPLAFQKIKYYVYTRNFIESSIKIGAALIFTAAGLGIYGVAHAFLAAQIISFFFAVYFFRKVSFLIDFKSKIDWQLVSYSLPIGLASMLWIVFLFTDSVTIGHFLGAAHAGIYNSATPIAMLLFIFPMALTSLFLPVTTGLHAQDKNFGSVYKTVSKWIFYSNMPLATIIIYYSREIITVLFGQQYAQASTLLIILTVGYAFYSLNYTHWKVLWIFKKTRLYFMLFLALTINNIILNYYLIRLHGLRGAAEASCISLVALSFFSGFFAYKITKIRILDKDYAKALICNLTGLLSIILLKNLYSKNIRSAYEIALSSIIFLAVYITGLILSKTLKIEDIKLFTPNSIIVKCIKTAFNRGDSRPDCLKDQIDFFS